MNKKLIFRLLGALSSSLIIVGVFIPFVGTYSLWHSYDILGTLYLPIMIIVFGVIGVIFFALNIKTEFAYMSAGALLFFLIMQTINIIDQESFSSVGVGYYCLVLGTITTGVMAFLCNLKTKIKEPISSAQNVNTKTPIAPQIEKIYNDQNMVGMNNIAQNSNEINPVPVQPVEPIQPVESIQPLEPPVQEFQISQNNIAPNPIPTPAQNTTYTNNMQSEQNSQYRHIQDMNNNVSYQQPQRVNPVVQQFVPTMQQVYNNTNENKQVESNMPSQPVMGNMFGNINSQSNIQSNMPSQNIETDIFGQPIKKD